MKAEGQPSKAAPVKVALIGSGVFMRDAHVPSLLRQSERLQIASVFSRDSRNAAALASRIPYSVRVTSDLSQVLGDDSIEAVVVALPIPAMPAVIAQCLQAGKHVLSEKPVAPSVNAALDLIEVAKTHPGRLWMVGENWRFEDAFTKTARIIKEGEIGVPVMCHWSIHTPFDTSSKYYTSDWRRHPTFPGGLLLDGGVHHIAVLRTILGEISRVSASTAQRAEWLATVDTLSATLEFASGAVGAYLVTYAASAPWPPILHITGDKGTLRVQRREIELETSNKVEQIACDGFDGVEKELVAFGEAIRQGRTEDQSVVEATRDLAVIEAMLESAARGGTVAPVQI